jgi:RNA polymerase sigma-70 factor (ECF subfamily)
MDLPDDFLIKQIAKGDEEAFNYIFRKFYTPLCVLGESLVKDDDLAQSIVQECFIRFWEKHQEAEKIKNIYAYMAYMVRNKCVDHLRQIEAEKRLRQNLSGIHVTEATEESVVANELVLRFTEAVEKLPSRCRTAFEYSRYRGLKYPQIADQMGISTKAVEALIIRALKILRKELSDYL